MKRVYALRGAVFCENTEDDICRQIAVMYDELLGKNNLTEDDIISLVFSVTEDLDVINPCAALRKTGRAGDLVLFGVSEVKSKNASLKTVRALLTCYLKEGVKLHHVYCNGAEVLRPDRATC